MLQAQADGVGKIVHQATERRAFLVQCDEQLAQCAAPDYAWPRWIHDERAADGHQIELVALEALE